MLGNKPRPFIGKLSELLISGGRTGFSEAATSPRTPLDLKMQSPRGLKNYNVGGGVGLGIVVALEKSDNGTGHEISAKNWVCSPRVSRSSPIPVGPGLNFGKFKGDYEDLEMDNLEDYTYVTCYGPNNKAYTKVYYDGSEFSKGGYVSSSGYGGIFNEPTTKVRKEDDAVPVYPPLDFLNSCHLCGKLLHGKDIYMYRGEKAFCSADCRSRQIMIDERKEQCRSEASKAANLSTSPYTKDQIFSTGVLAI
jgi:hypothetical protein